MAGQRITFGCHLDGQRPTPSGNVLGAAVVGPLGLLNSLETALGLLATHPTQAERIVQYRNCLQQCDTAQRFYHRSFATDPLGTAACLLDWRDQWILHGWDGDIADDAPSRLRDLAEVETLAATAVSPNVGQRLKAVLATLQRRHPDIEVELVDPMESLPARWQAVLAALSVVAPANKNGGGRDFLGALQRQLQLAASGQVPAKLAWQDDGTVLVVQAETATLANRWLAEQFKEHQPTLLVSCDDGGRLDAQLAAAGLPRQGLGDASVFRPALQVLPLALELLWDPANFLAVVQFLTHPICPVPAYARRLLAEKIADAPGIGGDYWHRTLDRIMDHYGEERAQAVREQIATWVEHRRFPSDSGAPLAAVIDRVARLVAFFRARLGDADATRRQAFQAGYVQCTSCLDSLQSLHAEGAQAIRPRQLQKLVTQSTARGAANPLWPAEVGAGQVVCHPGAAIAPVERVIWSPLAIPALPGSDPWSASELRALAKAGVTLPLVSDKLDQLAASWLRPVMAAREQLVLVLPPADTEVHPLWQMICAVTTQPRVRSLEPLLRSGGATLAPVAPMPLPALKRWWQLPEHVTVTLRPKESFSSLEKLLFNPYHWLLQYPARLKPSTIIGLGADSRLLGNLAHKLVEQYFLQPQALSMPDQQFERWFAASFDMLVDQEGAILRTPGRGADLARFRQRLLRAMHHLREQVAKAGMVQVVPERPVSGHFPGGELAGPADLMMENARGQRAIVDMKWSKMKKFSEKLQQNRHLQLAIYAELLRQECGAWPTVAYFILDQSRFLAPDGNTVPDADIKQSANGENTPQLWLRFLATWRWRAQQLQARQFELALGSIPADAASIPPEDAMAMEIPNQDYNDYRTLAGWENWA